MGKALSSTSALSQPVTWGEVWARNTVLSTFLTQYAHRPNNFLSKHSELFLRIFMRACGTASIVNEDVNVTNLPETRDKVFHVKDETLALLSFSKYRDEALKRNCANVQNFAYPCQRWQWAECSESAETIWYYGTRSSELILAVYASGRNWVEGVVIPAFLEPFLMQPLNTS